MAMTSQEANQLISKLAVLLNKEKGSDIIINANSHPAKGSDIIINANSHPAVKIDGKVRYLKDIMLTPESTVTIVKSLMSEHQWRIFEETSEMNFMLEYPGVAHFRTNAFKAKITADFKRLCHA